MRGLGIACAIDAGRPVVTGVLVDGASSSPTAQVAFTHTSDLADPPTQQLRSLADDLTTRLEEIRPDAVVIHTIDWFPQLRREVAKKRFMTEGALAATSRRHVPNTEILDGRQIGVACGGSKAAAESAAAALVGANNKAAGSAGLAALANALAS